MINANPPVGPHQLPPKTDIFTFVNLTGHPVDQVDFIGHKSPTNPVGDPDTGPISLMNIDPGATVTQATDPAFNCQAATVEIHAVMPGGNYDWHYDACPPNTFVCHVIVGLIEREGEDLLPAIVPFGMVVRKDTQGQAI
jgi:hypothetical protein